MSFWSETHEPRYTALQKMKKDEDTDSLPPLYDFLLAETLTDR